MTEITATTTQFGAIVRDALNGRGRSAPAQSCVDDPQRPRATERSKTPLSPNRPVRKTVQVVMDE
jgi:hypothetical protein